VDRIASTGAGLSKLIDLQHIKHLGVACLNCGFTEFYDLSVLEGHDTLGDILDIIFER
jgi:predicted nucleic-acid-binding Zn-ribbon protein